MLGAHCRLTLAAACATTCRQAVYALLPHEPWEATGGVEAKGKGVLQTYYWSCTACPSLAWPALGRLLHHHDLVRSRSNESLGDGAAGPATLGRAVPNRVSEERHSAPAPRLCAAGGAAPVLTGAAAIITPAAPSAAPPGLSARVLSRLRPPRSVSLDSTSFKERSAVKHTPSSLRSKARCSTESGANSPTSRALSGVARLAPRLKRALSWVQRSFSSFGPAATAGRGQASSGSGRSCDGRSRSQPEVWTVLPTMLRQDAGTEAASSAVP